MGEQATDDLPHLLGDKVRVKQGVHAGQRGVITRLSSDLLIEVELLSKKVVQLTELQLTNYSLAARRAWQRMPKRAGRPKATLSRKKMISLRIDRELWEQLGVAVDAGLIPSREQAVNSWVREHINDLLNS